MDSKKEIGWLYRQLPGLVSKGILPEETATKIREHYGPEEPHPGLNFGLIITAVLGAILIGGGIIMLFAYNWEDLSRMQKTVIGFIPLIVAQAFYGYAFFRHRDSISWVESTSSFLMLMLLCTLALISQVYNLGGELRDLIFVWLILSIPLLYLLNSTTACIFFLAGTCFWGFDFVGYDDQIIRNHLLYRGLIGAAVPHLWKNISPAETTIRGNILGWTLSIVLVMVLEKFIGSNPYLLINTSSLFVLLYMIGKIIYAEGESIWSRPFQTVSIAMLAYQAFSLTYEYQWKYSGGFLFSWGGSESLRELLKWINISEAAVFIAASVLVFILGKKRNIFFNPFIALFPVLIISCLIFLRDSHTGIGMGLFNLYIFFFGAYYVREGILLKKLSLINAGMFFLSILIVLRFFDSDLSFLLKGIVFIVIGAGFLLVNLIMSKKIKQGG